MNKFTHRFIVTPVFMALLFCAPLVIASDKEPELTGLADYPRIGQFEQGVVSETPLKLLSMYLDEVQKAENDYVNYSYSGGYTGSFSTTVTVVHGTGWYYPSGVYWGARGMPAYWHHRPTYGYNMGYNPIYAGYGGRYGFHQPWGGYSRYEKGKVTR